MTDFASAAATSGNVQELDLARIRRTVSSGKKDPYGDAEGVVRRPDELDRYNHASTVILVKDIADILVKAYPGWAWAVQPDERGGVINVYNLHCHVEFAYTIRMDDIMNDARRKQAHKAGDEVLRRFRMPNRMDPEEVAEAPRDAKGMMIPTLTDFEESRLRNNAEIALKLATGDWEIVETTRGRYLRKNR
jgi:hypothetical protein